MTFYIPTKRFQRQQQGKLAPHGERTMPISVYGKTTSKIAMLWSPQDNWDNNIVSAKMAKRLSATIEQPEKDALSVNFMGQTIKTKGYVQLKWGVEGSRQVHKTHFLVTTAEDPSFEVVLGRRQAIEYGLVQS